MGDGSDATIFVLVVVGRLLLPLLIFRFPIVGIMICLVLDGIDQTIFQKYTDLDLSGYQSYDKALDVYYLSLAYIATMRNWVNPGAWGVGAFLFFYRLAGVFVFEVSGATHRVLLLIFPNTFEYFFICYEAIRSRWDPARISRHFWIWAAALIWVFIKLPQEYWIHVAKLDVTDTIRDYPVQSVLVFLALAGLLVAAYFVGRTRAKPADHSWQIAAPPLPDEMDELKERQAFRIAHGRVFDWWLLEKIVLIALVCSIFVQILPGLEVTALQVTAAVAVLVIVNSFVSLFTARRGWGVQSALWTFVILAVFNVAFVGVAEWLLGAGDDFESADGTFFILLLTLIVSTYDRYRPVLETRLGRSLVPQQS